MKQTGPNQRHKWLNGTCYRCGISRIKKASKTLMAMHRGKDVYKWHTRWHYSFKGKKLAERPKTCI